MRFDKTRSPMPGHVNDPIRGNQRGLPIILLCGLLAGCSSVEKLTDDTFSSRGNFAGIAAADEPQAVLVGRDVLAAGGNATDAAVAMAFAMTVSLPSQVGFGSAGVCLAYDHGQKMVDSVDFVPRPVAAGGDQAGMVPAMPRGMFLLHANHGHIRWDQLLGPATSMAQHGVPASRAFIRQFAPVSAAVLADAVARKVFTRPDGEPIAEGDIMRNPELGTAIGRMAAHGVGEFYSGTWAQELVAAAQQAAGQFGEAELRGFAPQSRKPIAVEYRHETAYFAPAPALAGAVEADAWTHLAGEGTYKDASPESRGALVTKLVAGPAGGSTAGAALVAVDDNGSAVACQFTLNRLFGGGAMVAGFGTYLAVPPPIPGLATGPMIAVNLNSNEFRFAAAASGGMAGAQALIHTASEALLIDRPLPEAIASAAAADPSGAPVGIEAARCGSGKPDISRCASATDPRGAGLAQTIAEK